MSVPSRMRVAERGVVMVSLLGAMRCDLFRDDYDRAAFIKQLERAKVRRPFGLLAFVLVPRGAYLLMQIRKDQVSAIVHDFARIYSRYFNKRYASRGTVIEDRHSEEICSAAMARDWIDEVEWVPVYLGLAKRPSDWEWTSRHERFGKSERRLVDDLVGEPVKPRPDSGRLYEESAARWAFRVFLNQGYYPPGQFYSDQEFADRIKRMREAEGWPP